MDPRNKGNGQQTRWKRDGWEATVRIGLITLELDVGPESELQAMAPPGVVIHASRVPFGPDATTSLARARAIAEPPLLDDAVKLLAAAPLDAIAYGFVSSAYVMGAQAEAEMIARLERHTNGIPVIAACTATVEALRALDARRIALFEGPWFDPELPELGRRYYESAGFGVVYSAVCGLPNDQAQITPANLHAWVSEHLPAEADAIVIVGSGFRSAGAIAALEEDLGRCVVTANQALLWSALRNAGADPTTVSEYGRLFAA